MPADTVIRSIKLRLVVPRSAGKRDVPRALWATHAAVNAATAHYEQQLLRMRASAYLTKDGRIEEQDLVTELLAQVRDAQQRNKGALEGSDAELLDLLRGLYADIVPSFVGKNGNAQEANGFLGPLTVPGSRGFLEIFDKLQDMPNWLEAARAGEVEAFEAAQAWLQSEAGRRRLRATGAPAKWMRLARSDPGGIAWVTAFVADSDRLLEQVKGAPTRIRRLHELGVLPLFPPYFAGRIINADSGLTRWDRLAFRLAVGHLLSWESWCRRAAEDHARRRERRDRFAAAQMTPEIEARVDLLRLYEAERPAEIAAIGSLPQGERAFRIRPRMIRGWDEVRERWLKAKDRSFDSLLATGAEVQTRLRGRFGDPHLFRWLARPERHAIWNEPDKDVVRLLAALNRLEDIVEASRETALHTLPDPIEHPRSVQWEAEGGSNLKTYRLHATPRGLEVELPVLKPLEDGRFEDILPAERLLVAPSGQIEQVEIAGDRKRKLLDYTAGNGDRLSGKLGSADLLLDWSHLRHRRERLELIEDGDIGPAYLKLAVGLEPVLAPGWETRRPPALPHFLSAAGKATSHQARVKAGVRVLSVDLGVRSFAACSVFELREQASAGSLAFPVPDLDLVAVHERSFLLRLPGEKADSRTEGWRERARGELRELRQGLSRCRRVYRLLDRADEAREEELAALRDALTGLEPLPHELPLLEKLEAQRTAALPVWNDQVKACFIAWRDGFGHELAAWRRRTRARSIDKASGKSLWAVQYLTDVRRLLVGWSLLGQRSGDVRRLDRTRRGIFASRLLAHLDRLKEDRIKTGADLVVQAARGYGRNRKGEWEQRYAPCQIVLFEDLSRYRTRTDRPPRENGQLMRWAHRAIVEATAMQGQLYGLHTGDVGAAFTSRYHAASGTPGLRCRPLSRRDLEDGFLRERLERENPGLALDELEPGRLVPMAGGEVFACLGASGGVVRVHADLNAAVNLQRRFWTRHGEAFRLPARLASMNGQERWVPTSFGERLRGALGGYGWLEPTGHESGSCRWRTASPAAWRRLRGAAGAGEPGDDGSSEDVELDEIVEDMTLRSGKVTVFFRDPSGIVLREDLWYPAKIFWSIVRARTSAALRTSS